MKRFFFSAIALASLTAACTESGLIDKPEFYANEISFEPYIGKTPVTKAESIDEVYLQNSSSEKPAFHVYAFLHNSGETEPANVNVSKTFMSEDVWYDGTIWTYEGLEYWPDNRELAFVAYNYAAESCITSHPTPTTFEFTIEDDISRQVDLLATPFMMGLKDDADGDTKVNLVFKHLLSRVGFSVVASHPSEDVNIAIRSIKLCGNFPAVGNVDLRANANGLPYITPKSGTEVNSYSLFDDETCFEANSTLCVADGALPGKPIYANTDLDLTAGEWDERYTEIPGATDESRYMMIMPCQPGAEASIEVEYQLTSDIKRTARVPLSDWEFKAGYAYEFVLQVSTESIEFSAQMGGWDDSASNSPVLKPLDPSL